MSADEGNGLQTARWRDASNHVRSFLLLRTVIHPLGLVHAEARRRGGTVIVDHPPKPFFERFAPKVDQQPYGLLHETQVGEELFTVKGQQPLDRLDLYQ